MRIVARENESFYNADLSLQLKAIYDRSGVGITALSQLIDCTYATTTAYIGLRRSIVRSDVEKNVKFAIALLTEMCDKKILPLEGMHKKDPTSTTRIINTINNYLETRP